jgi:hypothetical protein
MLYLVRFYLEDAEDKRGEGEDDVTQVRVGGEEGGVDLV